MLHIVLIKNCALQQLGKRRGYDSIMLKIINTRTIRHVFPISSRSAKFFKNSINAKPKFISAA